jgi:hypothetical protein
MFDLVFILIATDIELLFFYFKKQKVLTSYYSCIFCLLIILSVFNEHLLLSFRLTTNASEQNSKLTLFCDMTKFLIIFLKLFSKSQKNHRCVSPLSINDFVFYEAKLRVRTEFKITTF